MFEHPAVSLVRGFTILAGVILLGMSVFHPLLLWLAIASLGLGASLIVAECIALLLAMPRSAILAAPPAAERKKES